MQNYLAHHGIKGQKWGVRRFQNLDGSLTPAGKKRYGEWKPGKKTFTSETKAVIARASNEVKPFEAKPIDEEETAKRGLLNEDENKKCISLAQNVFSKASKAEPKITEDLIDSAIKTGSKMYGLDYRLKQPTSLAAKIGADAKEKDLSFEEASKGIKDSVRYTVLSDTDRYTDNYNALKNELLEKGYSEVRFKNYFEKYRNGEVRHKAIQCTYQSPDGFDFEVQFHTPESQAVKELKIPLYEEIRKQGVSTERKERLEKEMQDLAERIPDPPGVYELKHSDTLDDVLDEFLSHSAKGTTWKDHKYIKKENGRYYYADDKKVSKTSSDELMDEIDAIQQQMAFCDQKAKEYDELAKSNPDEAEEYKAQAKKYRDEIERLNGEREQIAKGLEKKDKHDEIVNDFRNEPMLDTLNKYKKNIYLGNPKLKMNHSDTLDDVVDEFLSHSAKGTTWKDHKYIKKENGKYYYPEEHGSTSYEIKTDVWDDKELDKIAKEMQEKVKTARRNMQNTDDPEEKARYKVEMEEAQAAYDDWKRKEEKKPKHWLKSPYSTVTTSGSITYSEDLLDNFLAHYGVGPDDNPPGRGSGRYAKGTGENPYQHDDAKRAQMKKRGLFAGIQTALAKRKANTEIDRYRDYVDGMLNGALKNDKTLHEKYKELNERTDGKEFDRGPFRYPYNVPDELSGKEADREKLAAEWKKFSEEVVDKHAKAEAKSETLRKARETKAANKAKVEEEQRSKEELEAAKAKAIASGDPEQISKWLSEMSNQEQFDALNRIRQTKDIKSQAAAQVKAREDAAKAEEARRKAEEEAKRPKTKKELRDEKLKESFETAKNIMNTVDDVRQMAEKGIKFWNVIAAVNNATNSDFKLPKVDLNTGDKKKDKDKEENKENKEKDKNKSQQNNSGSTTNTNSNNTTYNTTNNYYNGEKKEKSNSDAETARKAEADYDGDTVYDWYDAPYKYEEAGRLLLEDFMKRKK